MIYKTEMPKKIFINNAEFKMIDALRQKTPAAIGSSEYIRSDLTGLQCFYDYEGELPNRLIALYADGSGCEMYFKKGVWHYPAGASLEDIERYNGVDKDWFIEAGYLWFIALPDDFKVWGECDG